MESSQVVSWQFENFSTAELSPPTSPASPSSPLFYHDGSSPSSPSSVKPSTMACEGKSALISASSSRAQLASVVLNEIERLHAIDEQNDFSMHSYEESVDLNRIDLFEAIADIEFTPPEVDTNLNSFSVVETKAPLTPMPSTEMLSSEFKSIVESLNANNTTIKTSTPCQVVNSFEDLIQITGIPTTTIVGDECLVPVELIGRPSLNSGALGAEEGESMDLDGIIISSDMAFINENDLFNLQEISEELLAEEKDVLTNSEHGETVAYWAKDMSLPVDELDTQMFKNDATLNALLQGDVSTAQSFMAAAAPKASYNSVDTVDEMVVDPSSLEEAEVIEVFEKAEAKKVERRGRKPNKKDSVTFIKDKALRKKEQNKTAATRYRQKKKLELVSTLSVEDELQSTHDELSQQRDKLSSEIKVIRSLLRDMLQARNAKKQRVTSPASKQPTASSLVFAQKLAARRTK